MYNISQKYKSVFIFIIKLLIIGGAYYIISRKISTNSVLNSSEFLTNIQANILNNYLIIFSILSFTILNWLLEIIKWKTLVSSIKNISFFEAAKQSLSSLTASLLTPNRIGEYGAKAIYYPKNKRYKIMFLNFLGNFSQMIVTILFGVLGLIFILKYLFLDFEISIFKIGFGISIFGIVVFFITKKTIKKYYTKLVDQLHKIPNKIHFKNFNLSFLRYIIFSHQFYFLLIIFGADINYFTAMQIIFTMYFLASLIPSFVIFDWLIKGSVAVFIFSIFGVNEILVLSITSIMWLLNFALPSVIGSYFVLTFNKPKVILIKENQFSS